MISKFISRGLYKTIDFLDKVKIEMNDVDLSLSSKIYLSLTYLNLKEYKKCYYKLLCDQSNAHPEDIVFCKCCDFHIIFLRNYSLFLYKEKVSIVSLTEKRDEFLLYLEGIVNKDFKKLLRAIKINPYFWEAYTELITLSSSENLEFLNIQGPLKDYFYMTMFTKKYITRKYTISSVYPNLEAAVYYHKREFDKSEQIFRNIVKNNFYFDLDYIDLYSNILYMNKNTDIFLLAQRSIEINKYRPESFCCIANYYSLKEDHEKAVEYYEMCLKINPTHTIAYTLMGHEYLELKNVKSAIEAYNNAIKICIEDYRAWFSLGKAYEVLSMNETALFFYKKAIEYKKSDSIIWISLGNVYTNIKDYDNAIRCYKKSVSLKNYLGYLYVAESYKSMKMYTESVDYYEKYVNSIKETSPEIKKICLFLEEYFRKICDIEKSNKYGNMALKE